MACTDSPTRARSVALMLALAAPTSAAAPAQPAGPSGLLVADATPRLPDDWSLNDDERTTR